jgi:hypothetical protein
MPWLLEKMTFEHLSVICGHAAGANFDATCSDLGIYRQQLSL